MQCVHIIGNLYCTIVTLASVFYDMTKKGNTFNWTKECNTAFKLLKEKLMEEPVLISPQVDKDNVIHCNAYKYSYSGILQQTRPSTEELAPVAYFSGNFDKTQVNWNITEKKLTLSTDQL